MGLLEGVVGKPILSDPEGRFQQVGLTEKKSKRSRENVPILCLNLPAVSARGRIVGRPPEEEDIEMKVIRLIEERHRDAPVM